MSTYLPSIWRSAASRFVRRHWEGRFTLNDKGRQIWATSGRMDGPRTSVHRQFEAFHRMENQGLSVEYFTDNYEISDINSIY